MTAELLHEVGAEIVLRSGACDDEAGGNGDEQRWDLRYQTVADG